MSFSFPIKNPFKSCIVFSSKLVEKEALGFFALKKNKQTQNLPNTHGLQDPEAVTLPSILSSYTRPATRY